MHYKLLVDVSAPKKATHWGISQEHISFYKEIVRPNYVSWWRWKLKGGSWCFIGHFRPNHVKRLDGVEE
jgi:hypothetical protein